MSSPGDAFKPFEYGRSLSIFLSDYTYTTPAVAVREMIANARDAYLDESTRDSPHHGEIYLTIDSLKKTFRCADYATGIINSDFQMMGSNSLGKTVGTRHSSVEEPDEEMIGQFHVGKASFAKMSTIKEGPIVSFYSNNGKEGLILKMLIRKTELGKELGWEDPPYRLPPELIDKTRKEKEIGLTVEVYDVLDDFLKVSYIKKLVGEQFGILIERKIIKVFIRNEAIPGSEWERILPAPEFMDCKGEARRKMDNDHFMTYCLSAEEKPSYDNIIVCDKHIRIKRIHSDFKVKGWINYNRLKLNGPRDGFQDDDRTEEMMRHLPLLLADLGFEKQHTKRDPKLKGVKDLTKLFANMIKQAMELYQRDPIMLQGVFSEISDIKGEILDNDKNHLDKKDKKKGSISRLGEGIDSESEDDPHGEIVVPIGTKRKRGRGKGKGSKGGKRSTWITDPDGIQREYLTPIVDQDPNRPPTGPIKPTLVIEDKEIGIDKPITYMEKASHLILNKSQPATYGILMMQKHYRQTSLGPFMAEALAEFIVRNRQTPTSIIEYRQMVNDLYTRVFFQS